MYVFGDNDASLDYDGGLSRPQTLVGGRCDRQAPQPIPPCGEIVGLAHALVVAIPAGPQNNEVMENFDVAGADDLAERAFRAAQQAAHAGRHAREAQLSAADSVQRSADSHERTAKAYDELAEHSYEPDKYRQHATRHREFAAEDRLMAEKLREMGSTFLTRAEPGDRAG